MSLFYLYQFEDFDLKEDFDSTEDFGFDLVGDFVQVFGDFYQPF